MATIIKMSPKIKEELNGRILFFIDNPETESDQENLFNRSGVNGAPLFGITFYGLKGGDIINLDEQKEHIFGFPFQYDEIPHKKLKVQAFFMKWHQFNRGDGHTIWGMPDYGGGGHFGHNPFNWYSDVKEVDYGSEDVELVIEHEIQPEKPLKKGQSLNQNNYEDHGLVRYFKMKSKLLSDFWGEDIYMGANVLLPEGYNPKKKYPVLYWQGHWPSDTPAFRYGLELRAAEAGITDYWNSGSAPKFIAVCIRDANMYYDDSYRVNSENMGPCGDALVKEFIPAIEKKFGGLGIPEGRALAGGSTGGWESIALQLFYPDFFGGSWPACCDGMDFHTFQLVDMYNDDSVYELNYGWRHVLRPGMRDTKGNVIWTMKEENYYELAVGGDLAHGLGQFTAFNACYCPVGEDGYPKYAYDPLTGKIDHEVVKYWEQHYDLNAYVERNHEWLIPKIKGKIHFSDGDMDNFYLNLGHYAITETLEKYNYKGYSKFVRREGHSFCCTMIELVDEIGAYFDKQLKKAKKKSK